MRSGWGRVERPDAEIWYLEVDGPGPTVVLLHGLAGYAREWAPVMHGLAEQHTVVAVEQRGHGSATRRPDDVSRRAYVDDAVAVLEQLGGQPAVVVGQSMGGHTAMLLAAEHPYLVTRLVMIEAGLGGGTEVELQGLVGWLHGWPAPFADRDEFVRFFGGDRMVAEAWADGLEQRGDGLWPQWDAETLGRSLATVLEREFHEEWEQVRAPTLLIRGEHGSIPDRQVETMRALRPDTSVVDIPGVGHDLHLEAPGRTVEAVRSFLAD